MPAPLPKKIEEQISKAGLPRGGDVPFEPRVITNRRGQQEIEKAEILFGPKKGKKGFVDVHDRIWIKCRAHSGLPDHWDVQIDQGRQHINVDASGSPI